MGRSGGGSGRSGGGFGGGRSSGGFSGGGRSSGGFSSGGGFGHSSGPHFTMGPRFGYGFGYPRRTGCGCGGGILIIIIFFIMMMSYIPFDFFGGTSNNTSNVEKSTKQREALKGVVTKTDWYDDQLGWISSEKVLISGLEDFYKETGIQPYVLFVPYSEELWNGNNLNVTAADDYLNKIYDERFEDEGHFIFAYFQCKNDSKQEMEGEFRYLSGYSADTIMDNEAISILWGYFETNYYNTSLTIEEMIANTFTQTADNIMQNSEDGVNIPMILSIIIIVIIVIIIIYSIISNRKRKKQEQAGKPADVIIEKDDNK